MSLSIIFYQPETKGFRNYDRKLSPPADSESLWLPELLESESHLVLSDSLQPHWLYSPWKSPGQNTGVYCRILFPSAEDFPNPGIEPRSPALWADSLPAEPPGKPKNTGVGSLSLLQRIFLAWEMNQGLLNSRQILYFLNHQGSLYVYIYD